jgi:hypothetical protein
MKCWTPHSQLATQRMVDFLHLTETPDDICERIEQLREIGVKNISCPLFTARDRVGMVREIGNSIISRFQA